VVESRRQVIWTVGARNELDDIIAYIAQDSPVTACTFLEEVLEFADSLSTLPYRGRIVPELSDPVVRELFIRRYRLLYGIQDEEVYVLSIIHGARDWE
jgi:toxin ParE1/3/4